MSNVYTIYVTCMAVGCGYSAKVELDSPTKDLKLKAQEKLSSQLIKEHNDGKHTDNIEDFMNIVQGFSLTNTLMDDQAKNTLKRKLTQIIAQHSTRETVQELEKSKPV